VLDPAAAAQLRGPVTVDGICAPEGWQRYWREVDAARRAGCGWWVASGAPTSLAAPVGGAAPVPTAEASGPGTAAPAHGDAAPAADPRG
jgi:hypothetical protein